LESGVALLTSDVGFYDSTLRKSNGVWKFTRLDVMHSLPIVGV
jgi:hypothetical protein